jgi:hypothetical protein
MPFLLVVDLGKRIFLVRQAKLVKSSWIQNQSDKVSRPSEPSLAFTLVTA